MPISFSDLEVERDEERDNVREQQQGSDENELCVARRVQFDQKRICEQVGGKELALRERRERIRRLVLVRLDLAEDNQRDERQQDAGDRGARCLRARVWGRVRGCVQRMSDEDE